MQVQSMILNVENSPTILTKVIQIIKRRRINIHFISAEETPNKQDGVIKIKVEINAEQLRKLKLQLEKQVEVLEVNIQK
jgi:acetolactate synthase small subunit